MWGLIVVATLITLVSSLTVWSKRQLLSTDNWTKSSARLLQNDEIRAAVSQKLVDVAFNQTNATAQLEKASPEEREQFRQAVKLGVKVRTMEAREEPVPEELRKPFEEADERIFKHVRALFGGRMREATTGAAPIAPEILEFFFAAGVPAP